MSGLRLPVVVVSDVKTIDTVIDVMRLGASDYVQKPFSSRDLVDAVRRALRNAPGGLSEAVDLDPERAQDIPDSRRQEPELADVAPHRDGSESTSQVDGSGPSPYSTDDLFRIRARLHEGTLRLPVMGPVLESVLELTRNPVASSIEVEELVGREPAIASAVLRLANSALYTSHKSAETLQEALVRIGNAEVINLARTVLLRGFFTVKGRAYQSILLEMWRNTIGSSYAARLLARQSFGIDPERAYTAALFHNAGEPLLVRIAAEMHPTDQLDERERNSLASEISKHHEEYGGILLRAWNTDRKLVNLTMRHHHLSSYGAMQPESAEGSELTTIVRVAYAMALEEGYSYVGAVERTLEPPIRLARKELSRTTVEEVKATLRRAVEVVDDPAPNG